MSSCNEAEEMSFCFLRAASTLSPHGGGLDRVYIYSWEVSFPLGQCEDMSV